MTEIDELESSLRSERRVQALFCELTSKSLWTTPDSHRISHSANQYGFVVARDEALGTFVKVDLLPFVDIAVTRMTKAL